jgi:hypothetical protein
MHDGAFGARESFSARHPFAVLPLRTPPDAPSRQMEYRKREGQDLQDQLD